MSDDTRTSTVAKTGAGFVAAGIVLWVLLSVIGTDEVIARFAAADTVGVAAVIVAAIAWLFSWSTTLRAVLSSLDRHPSRLYGMGLYSTAVFANNITPFGQAGGEPITAGTLSRTLNLNYERGLAAIASVDAVNIFPSIVFALLGASYTATQVTFSRRLEAGVAIVVGLGIAVSVGGIAAWRNRDRLHAAAVPLLTRAAGAVAAVVPFVDAPPREAVDDRVASFVSSIEEVGASDGALHVAVAGSTAGWAFQIIGLWLAFHAIGEPISIAVAMFAIPVSATASIAPLPGGTGGVEALMIGVVTAAASVSPAGAAAGVFLFRAAYYWLPIPLGAFSLGVIVAGTGGESE